MANQSNSAAGNSRIVTALFSDRQGAECAYKALSSRGYSKDDVDVMMSDETRKNYYSDDAAGETELGSKALEGTGTGAGIGGTVGAVLGAIAAIGTTLALPGLGLLIAGPLAGALVGAGAGGITGGLIGALVGSGIPEDTARSYETGIKSGGTVLGVHPRSDEDAAYFESEWRSCGGTEVYSSGSNASRGAATANTAASPTITRSTQTNVDRNTGLGETTIPVIEEELQIGKREVERGAVKVSSHVTEKPVEASVNLHEERVTVDRRPVDRPIAEGDVNALKSGSIEVTGRAEEAVVGKQARVVEEVVVSKDVSERTETVRDTVKRTDVDVQEINATKTNDPKNSR